LKRLGLTPLRETPIDTGAVAELLDPDTSKPALRDTWAFVEQVLGWEARHVAGAPGGPTIPDEELLDAADYGFADLRGDRLRAVRLLPHLPLPREF
jgi:hypothetical protein